MVVPHWQKPLNSQQLHSPIAVTLVCSMVVAVWMKCVARCLPRTAHTIYYHTTHLIGSKVYHRRVRSTRMPMRIGLQEQVAYLLDGLGPIPRTILRRISNPLIPVFYSGIAYCEISQYAIPCESWPSKPLFHTRNRGFFGHKISKIDDGSVAVLV